MFSTTDTFRFEFQTRNASAQLVDADATPTGTLIVNGTDNAATVTITDSGDGRYKGSVPLSGLSDGDVFYVRIAATVGGVDDEVTTAPARVGVAAVDLTIAERNSLTAAVIETYIVNEGDSAIEAKMTLQALATQQDAARLFALDETSGTVVTDGMGNADGAYVGTPTLGATGPHGDADAVTLNGSSQYANLGTLDGVAAGLTAGQGCTFSVWVQTTNSSTRQDLFGSLESSPDTDIQVRVNHDGTTTSQGYLLVRFKGAGLSRAVKYSADSGLCDGGWHHLALLVFGNSIRVYVDGSALTVSDQDTSTPTSFGSAFPQAMYLGASNNAGTAINFWTGSVSQCVLIPWVVGSEAIDELGRANPAAITATVTPANPYTPAAFTASRFAVDVTATRDEEWAVGCVCDATDDGDGIVVRHGSNSTAHTLEVTNLANREGATFENGVTAEIKRGTRTLAVESGTNDPRLRGFIVRAPDEASGTVIEAGSGTHCAPRVVEHLGVVTRIGCRLYDGARYAWSKYASTKVFDGISADDEERYHNGCAIVQNSTGIAFLSVGHNEPYLRIKTSTANDLTSLSSETQLGDAATELTYVQAAFTDAGLLKVVTRDQQGVNGLAVLTISDVFGTPTLDSIDYIVSGEIHYPRDLSVIGDDVYLLHQHREIGSAWQEISGCWYDATAGTWSSLDGVSTSGASVGTLGAPRFSTPADLVIVDNEADDNPQRYLLASAAWDHSGTYPSFVAVIASTETADATAYADTTLKLLGWDGSAATQTGLGLDTGNSYRQSAAVSYRESKALVAVTDRGSYKPHSSYDEAALYYAGWGGPRLRVFEVASPFGAAPTLVEWTEPTSSADTAGWIDGVSGSTRDLIGYHATHEGDHLTRAQAEYVEILAAPNQLEAILEDTGTTIPASIVALPTKAELDAGLGSLNDLDAAGIRTAIGMASADLDTQLASLSTFDPTTDEVDADVKKTNGVVIVGAGVEGDEFRGENA